MVMLDGGVGDGDGKLWWQDVMSVAVVVVVAMLVVALI